MTIPEIIKIIEGGSYVGVLALYGILAYKLADKWADKIVVALNNCAKAFGALTRAIDGGKESAPPAGAPSTRNTPLPKEKR